MYPEITSDQMTEKASRKELRVANYLIAIFVNIILLYVVNNLISNVPHPLDQYASKDYPGLIERIVNWAATFQAPFLNTDFVSCLWAINLALGLAIMGNFVLLLYRPQWFHHLVQAVICASGFVAVYLVLKTFPFNISSSFLTTVIRTVLIALLIGLSIGLVIELIKFIRSPLWVRKNTPRVSDGSDQN
jgi:hypothetical protein